MDDDAISPAAEPAKAGKHRVFDQSDWWNEAVQICMEVKDYCFPQAIGTYVSLSRGLHQLGSSFLPPSFLSLPSIQLFAVADFPFLLSLSLRLSLTTLPPFHTQKCEKGEGVFGLLVDSLFGYHVAGPQAVLSMYEKRRGLALYACEEAYAGRVF